MVESSLNNPQENNQQLTNQTINNNEEENKKQARKTRIKEGCFSAFSSGLGDNYIIAFAKELSSSSITIGMLNAFPGLLSPLAQVYGSRLIEKKSRKEIVVQFVFIQCLLWVP